MRRFEQACRKSVPEGIVLLETDGTLPLKATDRVALFGRGQFEYEKSGSGSGGLVRCPYVTNIADELKKRVALDETVSEYYRTYIQENPFDWGDGWIYPTSQKQPELDESFVAEAANRNDKAIYVICRICGESYDCKAEKGNWYLSDTEEQNLQMLRKYFPRLIVLVNAGNPIDVAWVKKYEIGTLAYIWQGGQEGGAGTVDALIGTVPPSGRLADTFARIEAYPSTKDFGDPVKNIHTEDIYVGYRYFETFAKDEVFYPFGYGLGYTEFSQELIGAEESDGKISVRFKVKNIGTEKGKDVVQLYYQAPQGALGNPARQLIAFQKTKLLSPSEEAIVELQACVTDMAAYDDSGKSGFAYSYVLEQGEYKLFGGKNVRDAKKIFSFRLPETKLVKACKQALAPRENFERIVNKNGTLVKEPAPQATYSLFERMKENAPSEIPYTGNRGITLKDVADGKRTMDELIAQADVKALCQMVRGEGMSSPKGAMPGTASCFAGVTAKWSEMGVPVVSTCDGPCGIRLTHDVPATCIPTSAMIACAWSPEAFEEVFACFADEMLKYHIDVNLGPGMNIHRSPLCGRNFEYYSEDPYLTGRYATKVAEIFSSRGVYCTLKHFAVNSQEVERGSENEVLSERALREIYLKGFEMAVKSGFVQSIMTSYNRINGLSAAGNYDLTTTVLREDWGYQGFVMTDWWTNIYHPVKDSFSTENLATMVKAQNDIYMCMSDTVTHVDDLEESVKSGYLSIGELQRCVKNLLSFVLKSHSFTRGEAAIWKEDLLAERETVYTAESVEGTIKPCLPENTYVAEVEYLSEGDLLQQIDLKIEIVGREDISVTVNKTGKTAKCARFNLYLQVGTVLRVKSKEIISLKILK